MKYLLDTHVWIWWHMSPEKLSKRILAILSNPDCYSELLLSAISVWEFAKLVEKSRLVISCKPLWWVDEALQMAKLRLVPLAPKIACQSTSLTPLFHADPADQIITATAIIEKATLISADTRLLSYGECDVIW